jgi:hypothetical protein
MTLRKLLEQAAKVLESNPDALDLPVYAVCASSGAFGETPSLHLAKVVKYDLSESSLSEKDLGKAYVSITY